MVFGASGMLGSSMMRVLSEGDLHSVVGVARSQDAIRSLPENLRKKIKTGIDAENIDKWITLLHEHKPDTIINCIGLVKQLSDVDNPLVALPINSLFPHRLFHAAQLVGARVIHFSTDCVFSGNRGMYVESDPSDVQDMYGISKKLGELEYENSITLRTSIIGHELRGNRSLVDWFLSQSGSIRGYSRAIFSGLPTVVLAKIVRDIVIPQKHLCGIYHVSADPISKYDLLKIIADIYGKKTIIVEDDSIVLDRSLDSSRFREQTGFIPMGWVELVKTMHNFQ